MKKIAWYLLLCLCVVLVSSSPKGASGAELSPVQEIRRQQEQIILQQQEQFRRQQDDLLRQRAAPSSGVSLPQLDMAPLIQDAPCMEVARISISGSTFLSTETLNSIAAKHENQCLSVAAINNILRELTNLYIAKGYVTSRAFLDPQQGEAGELRLRVVEGLVEEVQLNNGDPDYYYRGRTAFPFMQGKILNLRDIEQGLDQLNRLPSGGATMELAPGKELGGSIVKVALPPKKSWRLGLGMDNLGQRSSGQWQYTTSLEKDNFLGIGDQVALTWSADTPFMRETMANPKTVGDHNSLSAYLSIPWGWWTFSASMSHFDYFSRFFGMNSSYTSTGTTGTHSIQAERVLHRDEDSKTSLSLGITHHDVDTYIESTRLYASSYVLATLDTSLSHNRRFLGGSLNMRLDHKRGVAEMGTERTISTKHSVPKDDFDKFAATLSWYRPFTVGESSFYWHTSAFGQWSDQTMYGVERLSLGSRYTVHGFHEQSGSGDQGGYVRNELGWNIPLAGEGKSAPLLTGVQLYVGHDYGALVKDKQDPFEQGEFQGIVGGIRTQGDVALDLSVAKPLTWPGYLQPKDAEVYFSIKYTF